jgi:acyl-CoA synthetase (AMP-forming)/AMP-acid ligase II
VPDVAERAASEPRSPFDAFGPLPDAVNVALELRSWAERTPDVAAVRAPNGADGWNEITYAELEAESDAYAHLLAARGVAPGDRVCVFVRAGIELIAATYGLFKLGAVPVLIDPGMGPKSLLACVARIAPRALVGIPAALFARRLFRRAFRTVEVTFGVPRRGSLRDVSPGLPPYAVEHRAPDAEAAILFTSGSTGPAKGVVYTHATFRAQLGALSALYDLRPGEVDVACFPLFALFDTALGLTSVFPDFDPSHPARCDPSSIERAIVKNGATLTFGSPAIWKRVVPWLIERDRHLPGLRRVLIAGAPVPPALVRDFHRVLDEDADVFTPYGATEALPVSSISGRKILALAERAESGEGTCVGTIAPGIDLRLIRITDEPLERWNDSLEVPAGEPGEICVRGPVVTSEYKFEPEHNRAAKIPSRGHVWHRMGDVGRLDANGLLWFHGRKSHRLDTERGLVMPVPQENIFNTHPAVRRSALVGVGPPGVQLPVLVVEREDGGTRGGADLARSIATHRADLDGRVAVRQVLFHRSFPVDVRHNAKIDRGELREWASRRIR